MGLKFRRGTTAQKSGSLAYGEPYVNTTLGTLQIGGESGDITLGASGTGSAGSFAGISGSSLDITGNAKIDGNLTLGGNITIGDNTSDTVAMTANLSSSLIPSLTNTFDLGSAAKQWRHLYISTGSVYMNGVAILSSNATDLTLTTDAGQSLKLLESAADTITLQTAEGNLTLTSTGAGDIILDPTTGVVSIKGTLQVQDGNKITSSGGNTIQFGNNVGITGSLTTTTGLTVGGDFVVNGTTTTIDSTNINIGDNIIVLNGTLTTNGGMYVKDAAGGNTATGSMLWDTTNDKWIAGPKGSELAILRAGGDSVVSGSAQIDGSLLGSNKTITIGSTSTTLGGTSTTIAGLTSVTSTAFVGALTGNASTVTTNANLTGNVTSVGNATTIASGVVTSDMIVDGTIVNGDINASAAIVDTKLATISTGGKVSNSATTATSANTVSAIVARDGSGNFSAGTITAALTGNASTATTAAALTTARTINGTSFDGSANITIPNLVSGSAQITHSSTTGYVANEHIDHTGVSITAGDGLTGGGTIAATRTINVVGTANRISVSADAVDIASTYVGQNTITTLGTITTGTWTGTAIASANLDTDTAHLTETQTFSGAKTFSTAVTISDSTASTSKTTGALKVTGGVGVSGDMYVGGDVVAYASSDIRFKENIVPIENALDKISKISGNTYDWKAENKAEHGHEGNDVGVIAQEIEAVLPQLVQTRENGFKAVKYDKLVALLIEGIKEQQTQIEKLRMDLDNYECKCDNCKSK